MTGTNPDPARPGARSVADAAPASWLTMWARVLLLLAALVTCDRGLGALLDAAQQRSLIGRTHGGLANAAVAAEPELLVLGSSRALLGVDDALLTELLGVRSYNAACGGRGLLYARGLRALVAHPRVPHPRVPRSRDARPFLVLVDLSWFEDERDRAGFLAPFHGQNAVVDEVLSGGEWRARLKLSSACYRYQGRVFTLLSSLGREPAPFGHPEKTTVMAPRPLRRDTLQPVVVPPPWYESQLEALVRETRSDGADIVFMEAPSWGTRLPQPVRGVWDRVARREGVPFLSYLPQEHGELRRPELFADPGHLNSAGATVLTQMLAEDLAPLLGEALARQLPEDLAPLLPEDLAALLPGSDSGR